MSKVPPQYGDLGKSARDLFDKGYNYGSAKVDFKTKSTSGVEFMTKGSSVGGRITGSLETKYKRPEQGITFTEKWTTDNNLSSEIAIEDQLATGLKLTCCTAFSPDSGKKSCTLKTAYKRDYLHLNLDSNLNWAGPIFNGAAVFGCENWLGGFQFGFDSAESHLTKYNFAMGYNGADFQTVTTVNGGAQFAGSIYQTINEKLSTGIQLSWAMGQSNSRLGIAAKYSCSDGATLNAKVDNEGQVGLGYSSKLQDGVKLTLSSLVNGKNFQAGGHQLGVGLEFEV